MDYKNVFINEPIIFYEQRKPSEKGEVSKTLETSLENLLTRFKTRYEISKIYDKYAPEYKYIILNDVNYISNFLFSTDLSYQDFKKYVNTSSKFYKDYIENEKTVNYPKIKNLCESIAKKDYANAYREYIKHSNTYHN